MSTNGTGTCLVITERMASLTFGDGEVVMDKKKLIKNCEEVVRIRKEKSESEKGTNLVVP
jgi:hypothetical protein